jgi:uncharacterized membrane protein (UPF0127 family)
MKQMRITDQSGKIYFPNCSVAENAIERMIGLLGKKNLDSDECLWIEPCNSIHTFFMKFPIDVAFTDAKGEVVAVYTNLKPWKHSRIHFRAKSVLEAKAGSFEKLKIQKGKVLKLCPPL